MLSYGKGHITGEFDVRVTVHPYPLGTMHPIYKDRRTATPQSATLTEVFRDFPQL